MKSLLSFGLYAAVLQTLAAGAAVPSYFQRHPLTRRAITSAEVERELGPSLSNTTSIYGPNDSFYRNGTSRWNVFARPNVEVIVMPGQESDVAKIVQYAYENSIEILTYNRGHGWPKSLAEFNGIQINLANLRWIEIQSDKKSAWFGGGAYDGEVSRYLWSQGFVTTTGSCDCVGMMGPGLGGGHGRHEALYGMISDNIRQLNVVLANGTSIRVNSTSHPDLLWGMKGAGHNFGVVTSFEMSIFPRGPDTWFYKNYLWSADKLDAVFTALNRFHGNGSTPVNMTTNFGQFYVNSTVSEVEPIIWWTFSYRGCEEEAKKLLAPFDAIPVEHEEHGNVPYPTIADVQGTGEQSILCQHDNIHISSTSGLEVYNLTTTQQIMDGFTKRMRENPTLANRGIITHEGYATKGVDDIPSDSSAYPFRADHHLNLFLAPIMEEERGTEMEEAAWTWAREVVDQWNGGQPHRQPNAYVNYANGFEGVEQWYGHEAWRLERLRGLKAAYDPYNKFRFYNPIVQTNSTQQYPAGYGRRR